MWMLRLRPAQGSPPGAHPAGGSRAPSGAPRQGSSGRSCATRALLGLPAPPAGLLQLEDACPEVQRAFQLQDEVVSLLEDELGLRPAEPQPSFVAEAQPGGAAAAVRALTGPRASVRWVSASAVGNAELRFGTTRLMAWAPAASDAPHFVLEQGVLGRGGTLQGVLTLWPRRDLVLDPGYVRRYYGTVPAVPSGLRSYNDVWNAVMELGWQHYQVPFAELKPVLFSSISYTFEATPENQEAFRTATLHVARLWAAQASAAERSSDSTSQADEGVRRYDERYVAAVYDDPGNALAAKLFGEGATQRMLQLTCGQVGGSREPVR